MRMRLMRRQADDCANTALRKLRGRHYGKQARRVL